MGGGEGVRKAQYKEIKGTCAESESRGKNSEAEINLS